MRLLALTVLAGGVAIMGSVLMLGWLYEGPRRLVRLAACYIGFHGPETWASTRLTRTRSLIAGTAGASWRRLIDVLV